LFLTDKREKVKKKKVFPEIKEPPAEAGVQKKMEDCHPL